MSDFVLPPRLVISQVAACRSALIAHLAGSGGEVRLDGSAVEELDTAGLQLLLATARTAGTAQRGLGLYRCSAALRGALELAGVTSRLGVTDDPPPQDAA